MTDQCGNCHIDISQEDSICCDGCNLWYHLICTKLTNKKFKELTIQPNKKWYCKTFTLCKKCDKLIKGNSICCDTCTCWYHQR